MPGKRGNALPWAQGTEGRSQPQLTCTSRWLPRSAPRSRPRCTPRSALPGGEDSKGQQVSWQHGDTSPCFPGEDVKPLALSPRVSPSTMLSFAGMGDASTGYFWTVAVVGRVVAAMVPAGSCCRCPSLSPLATRCLPLLGARVAAGEDRAELSGAQAAPESKPAWGAGSGCQGVSGIARNRDEHLLLGLPSCSGWWRGASCLASTSARKSISASKLGTEVRPMGQQV